MTNKLRIEEKTWAEEEFAEVNLNDERLNDHCQKLAEVLGQQPTASINQACEDWADTKAAYRFFENPNVSPDDILLPHRERSVERMKGYKIVLAIQDTTFFNYTHHPETQGLGEIGTKGQNQRGFGLHSTLAVTTNGQPFGLLTQAFIERPIGTVVRPRKETKKLPIEEKES